MERFQFKKGAEFVLFIAGLLCMGNVEAMLAGNPQLNNNYFGHLNDYQKALLVNNNEHHLEVAITKLASGKKSQIEYVKQQLTYLLPRWPNHAKALRIVSEVALRTHDPSYAQKWYTKAISAFPRVYQTYELYGMYLYRIREYKQAEKNFRQAVQLAPDSSETNYNMGLVQFSLGNYGKANRYAHKAYRLGYPLDGLRKLLQAKNAWKPVGGDAQASAVAMGSKDGSSE